MQDDTIYQDIQTALSWRAQDARNIYESHDQPGVWHVGVSRQVLAKQAWLEGVKIGLETMGYTVTFNRLDSTAPGILIHR